MTKAFLMALFVVPLGIMFGGCTFKSSCSPCPASDHFDGTRFYNQDPAAERSFFDFLRWVTSRNRGAWEKGGSAEPGPEPPERVGAGELRITFIHHATLLIQMDGINILTDPVWSERASPVSFAGPRRIRPPGIPLGHLPPLDAIVISHDHYDHLDLQTLKRLCQGAAPAVYVPLGLGRLVRRHGIGQVQELDWWQQLPLGNGVTLTCVPAQHFSGRGLFGHNRTLWAGFVFSSPAGAVYFAGDTGFGPHFSQIAERFSPIRLALLPIGAYLPEWFMSAGHLAPRDALKAHQLLRARVSAAMHFGTFPLGDDGQHEAPAALIAGAAALDMGDTEFWVLGFGEGRCVPPCRRHTH